MIDKKTSNQIDLLIKKLKDNELNSIKISNKTNSIEITNAVSANLQSIHQVQSNTKNQNSHPEETINILSIDSPMVGIVYMTPKPSSPPFIKSGQKVKKGDIIGFVGSTGRSQAPHLHYEVHKDKKRVNPINFYLGNLTPDEFDDLLKLANQENQSLD